MAGQAGVKGGVPVGFAGSVFESAWDRREKVDGAVEESFGTLSNEFRVIGILQREREMTWGRGGDVSGLMVALVVFLRHGLK